MRYREVIEGVFIQRPNRFIAYCEIGGVKETCHVKNTGRCRELLISGVRVVCSVSDNPSRKTRYDLIAVYKGDRLVNIDSQAPNQVVGESFSKICTYDSLNPEFTYGESRFDFSAVRDGKRIFVEVKGVTKETGNVVCFPDAPTERGLRHVRELTRLAQEGFECYIVFVVQMSGVDYFIPDYAIHDEFGKACEAASKAGVKVLAFDCEVSEKGMDLGKPVEVRF